VFLKKKNTAIIYICLIYLVILTGCFNQKATPEKIYEVLENAVIAEKTFEELQSPIIEAEKKEKEIYDQIISKGMKEKDQITQLADRALKLVEERKSLMASEIKSIEQSKNQFEQLRPLIDHLNDPTLQQSAQNLNDVMMERYTLHDELQSFYTKATELDKALYHSLKRGNMTMEELEGQINEINALYERIYQINNQFNASTEKYNQLKLAFYQEAGLNIESKD
jgi:chromosome segregation ATPase